MSEARVQYGEQPTEAPPGMLRPVFIKLAPMDTWTGDGRRLQSSGKGVRPLPFSLFAQFKNAGHWEAELVGSVNEVVFDDGWAFGRGWVLDDINGRKLVAYRKAGAMSRNSVDLADVKVEWILEKEGEDDLGDIWVIKFNFVEWKIGATTLLAPIPAFEDASFDFDPDDDVLASMSEDRSPLVLDDLEASITFEHLMHEEITASAGQLPPWEVFHQPEAPVPHKITVHADRTVSGHLALWDTCHAGIATACVIPPKPTDEYASFNQPGVLTDQGMVSTGPIFLAGGHPRVSDDDFNKAYGGVENTWCDVRVTPGKFGPWVSGIVRPGVSDEDVYKARASRCSGHWRKGDLRAIVSVNAEGYNVKGDVVAGMVSIVDGEVEDLIASFPDCARQPDDLVVHVDVVAGDDGSSVEIVTDDGTVVATLPIDDWDASPILDEVEYEIALAEAALLESLEG